MSSPIPALSGSFQEPQTPDQTSAPAIQPPQQQSPVAQALNKKKKPFGAGVKNPGALAASIQKRASARAARPNQTSNKWGAP